MYRPQVRMQAILFVEGCHRESLVLGRAPQELRIHPLIHFRDSRLLLPELDFASIPLRFFALVRISVAGADERTAVTVVLRLIFVPVFELAFDPCKKRSTVWIYCQKAIVRSKQL